MKSIEARPLSFQDLIAFPRNSERYALPEIHLADRGNQILKRELGALIQKPAKGGQLDGAKTGAVWAGAIRFVEGEK
jgi:hypothetical protein